MEVMLNSKVWRARYRMGGRDSKQEKVTLGHYPDFSLLEARMWRDDCKALVSRGLSPMALKRGDTIPEGTHPAAHELAEAFIRKWCPKTLAKAAKNKQADTVEAFGRIWLAEIVEPANQNPRNIRRILEKDVFPVMGSKHLDDVAVSDIITITDRIKNRGADQMALQTRNVLKRLFAFAISRQKIQFNPAAALEGRYIAQAKSRDVALTPSEIGQLLQAIYASGMKRAYRLALHLLIICMVRKGELTEAKWDEIDFDRGEWSIPSQRMKLDRPHLVPLSRQALAMFSELKALSSGSVYVFPSRGDIKKPISRATLNQAVAGMSLDIRDFVLHDFRRTASTHLHEAGFNTDYVEKALAHEQGGVRGVYNRAEYLEQRREMLQWWANFVDTQIEGRQGRAI